MDEFVSTKITKDKVKGSVNSSSLFLRLQTSNYKVVFTAIILLFITYSGMMIVSNVTKPFYKKNIFQSEEKTNFITRGRTSVLFQKSLSAINNHDYNMAIKFLKEDIVKNSNENSIFYSYYVLGLTYLKSAESNFLGTIQSFDHVKIENGIENLFIANEKNNSGDYDNLKIDAHYYIAKVYLSIDAIEDAKKHLQIVREKRGKYYSDTVETLNLFENDDQFKSANNK